MENTKITGNEPYFPFFSGSNGYHDCFDLHGNGNHFISFNSGISIRQKFASDIITGMYANSWQDGNTAKPLSLATRSELSRMAIEQADDLIKALNETPNSNEPHP